MYICKGQYFKNEDNQSCMCLYYTSDDDTEIEFKQKEFESQYKMNIFIEEYVQVGITEYFNNGGKILNVCHLDLMPDSNTITIKCTNGYNFYINLVDKTFHTNYPTDKYNIVRNEFIQVYLLHRINVYLLIKEKELERNKYLFKEIENLILNNQ